MVKGKMMRADEFCSLVTDGTHDSPKAQSFGKRLITSKNLKGYYIDFESARYICEEDYKKMIARSSIEQWDILYSMIGTVGNIYLEKNNFVDYACKNIGIFKFSGNKDNAFWMYYYLKSNQAKEYVQANLRGSTQSYISLGGLRALPIWVPEKNLRDKIVSVLKSIDQKIENNLAINDNLEQQIKMLIRAWFVEYLPFGGKIPNDWHSIPLSKIADFISGYSYKGNELKQSRTAMLTIKNFERNGGFKLNGFKELIPSSKIKPDHYVELFDTVVAHTDLTQKAEVIGNAELVLNFAGYDSVVFSMDLVKVIPKKEEVSKFMIAALLQNSHFKAHCLGYVNGTTVLHLSKRALPEYQLLFPDDLAVLAPLDKALRSMYMRMAFLIEENQKLQNIRDTLLPRLMSGEIDVSNIDL